MAVIDHHRRAANYIDNAALNFHEPYASSACELVTELLQYLLEPTDLLRARGRGAAGRHRAGHQAASPSAPAGAPLKRPPSCAAAAADTVEVKRLFQNDL